MFISNCSRLSYKTMLKNQACFSFITCVNSMCSLSATLFSLSWYNIDCWASNWYQIKKEWSVFFSLRPWPICHVGSTDLSDVRHSWKMRGTCRTCIVIEAQAWIKLSTMGLRKTSQWSHIVLSFSHLTISHSEQFTFISWYIATSVFFSINGFSFLMGN